MYLATYHQVSLGARIFLPSGDGGANSSGDGVLAARAGDLNTGVRDLAELVHGLMHRLRPESDWHFGWFGHSIELAGLGVGCV